MNVRFWGVRGSTPTPHNSYLAYGGHTSCVEVRTDGNAILVFDGGTGIRVLGNALEKEFDGSPIQAHVFFSHFHSDHIQGVPFFTPLYSKENKVSFYVAERRRGHFGKDRLSAIMANPFFPVPLSKLPCKRDFHDLKEETYPIADAMIHVRMLNHPQGCAGYRVTQGDKVIAYCTDVEHGPKWSSDNFEYLAKDADCLIVDAQYTPEEYSAHEGWGHSSWKQSVEMGLAANSKKVVLFHHDPYHDDSFIDAIAAEASKIHPDVVAAREGLDLYI